MTHGMLKKTTAFAEDVLKRFDAYGWHTQEVADGNDVDAIAAAIEAAKAADAPSIIKIETKIGYGAPNKQGKAAAHGEPLGDEEIKLAKENLGWPYPDTTFYVPEEVKALFIQTCKKMILLYSILYLSHQSFCFFQFLLQKAYSFS